LFADAVSCRWSVGKSWVAGLEGMETSDHEFIAVSYYFLRMPAKEPLANPG
jgi:hypothetical protein